MLENRFEVDRSALSNPQAWINNWATLVTTLSASTQTARRLMVTPISNPDSAKMTWVSPSSLPVHHHAAHVCLKAALLIATHPWLALPRSSLQASGNSAGARPAVCQSCPGI